MRRRLAVISALCAALLSVVASSCHKVDDDRIPYARVYIPFTDVATWDLFGVAGAGSTRAFIKSEGIPSDYFYTDLAQTGFGGVLLVGSYTGEPHAYDMACPVECRRNVIVSVDGNVAVCHTCGSSYDIFNAGSSLSGPAAQHHYGLTRYAVGPGANGIYMVIIN